MNATHRGRLRGLRLCRGEGQRLRRGNKDLAIIGRGHTSRGGDKERAITAHCRSAEISNLRVGHLRERSAVVP